MPYIQVRGETLHYRRAGRGAPLVLVHSLGTCAELWRDQFDRWSDRFEVVAFDARGHGASTNNGGVGMGEIAADLHAALGALGLLPAHVVGISMGGLIASRLHGIDPAAMLSLVISGSFVTLGADGPKRAAELEDRIRRLGLGRYGPAYAGETLLPGTPRQRHEDLAGWISGMELEAYVQTMRSIFTEDVTDCMKAMRLPVRVLVGEEDRRTPPALAERIAGTIPGAGLRVIPGAAHLANLDAPDAFGRAVEEFLDAIGQGRG